MTQYASNVSNEKLFKVTLVSNVTTHASNARIKIHALFARKGQLWQMENANAMMAIIWTRHFQFA